MATKNQSEEIQKGVKELEKEITCPVCHNYFQEPKILPCLHYYCKECIQALAQRAGDNKSFPCPECRRDTILRQNDSDQLPTAFMITRMVELHAKIEKVHGNVEAMCEQCSEPKAVAFCRHCMNFICNDCVKVHEKMRTFSNHEVATLEELKEGGTCKQILLKQALAPPPLCKVHEEQMKIYCYDCDKLICRDCVIVDHAGHKYDFVKKAAPEIKTKLTENLVPLKETKEDLDKANEVISSTKFNIKTQGASLGASIEQSFQGLQNTLERHKRELLEKTSSLVKGKLDQLNVQEKGIDMVSGTIQSLVEFVEQNIENATDEELMTIQTQMMNRIEEETEKHKRNSAADLKPVEETDIFIRVECAKELKTLCQEKMIITSSPVDPFKSILQGNGIKSAEINKTSKAKLYTVFSCSNHERKPISIKARLVSSTNRAVAQAGIEQVSENTYEIKCTPSIRGRHQLEVTVNDLPVTGSPFPVFVKIPPTQLGKPLRTYPGLEGYGVAFNSHGDLVFAECGGDVVLLDKAGNQLHRIMKSQHGFQSLFGIAVDDDDNIYVTDSQNGNVFKFDQHGAIIKSVRAAVDSLAGIAVSGDQVIVADVRNYQLLSFTRDLYLARVVDCNSGKPIGVACDHDGSMYVCNGNCVQVFNTHGVFLYSFSDKGNTSCKLDKPHSICVAGDFVYVTEWGRSHSLSAFTKEGKFIASFGKSGSKEGEFHLPSGLAMDSDGILYVCDYGNSRIQVF